MSEENEGENNQNNALTELEDFDFYFRFIKPLVLELPTEEDRGIGAAWAQKLEQVPLTEEERQQRLNYVKLLLFVLQRGRLSGIFKKQPPSGPLQPFPQGFSILDMGNWMLDQDDAQVCGGGDAGRVPYDIELSNDLREYAASQEIPNFGVQMYYAWSSDDPVNKWLLFDEDKFPQYILDKIKQINDTKSDDKATVTKKKGCELNLPEKYSKKKVKSPQEIEKSQGRSFHTYMGLVGRMGNFNDKCDDDPEKYQRLEQQRKGKCSRKPSAEKRCPTNAGEAEIMGVEEEYDNLVSGLGGMNAQNRPCHCPYPFPSSSPDRQAKGLQPGSCPDTSSSPIVLRGNNNDSCQYSGMKSFSKSPGQCSDYSQSGSISPVRNAPRQRSQSPVYNTVTCPGEEEVRDPPNQCEVCVCSNPPCTCPCPRGAAQGQTRSNTFPAGASCLDPNRVYDKPTKSDAAPRSNNMGPCMNSLKSPQPSTSAACRQDAPAPGGRPGGMRNPEVVHCYDTQMPETAQMYNRGSTWQPCGPPNRQTPQNRAPCPANARENRGEGGTRRVLFENQSPNRNFSGPCQQHEANESMSANDSLCGDNTPEAVYERGNRPGFSQHQHPPQNFQSCEPPRNHVQSTCSSPEVVYDKADQSGPSQSCRGQTNQPVSQGLQRPNDSIYYTCNQDLENLFDLIRKMKLTSQDAECSSRPQPAQGSTCPQPAQSSSCPQGPQPSQVRQQQPQPAQTRQRQPQPCSPQSQMRAQQSRPAQVCPQQQPAQVCPQPRQPQICPQSSRPNHQVCPQSPRSAQTRIQQPPTSQVCSPQSHSPQVCSQPSQPARMRSPQSRPAQPCPQQAQPSQVCPQQAQPSQVCPQPSRPPQPCQQSSRPPAQPCTPSSRPPQPQTSQACQQQSQPQTSSPLPGHSNMYQQETPATPTSSCGSPFSWSYQASPIPHEPFQSVQIWSDDGQMSPVQSRSPQLSFEEEPPNECTPVLYLNEECGKNIFVDSQAEPPPVNFMEFNEPSPVQWLSPQTQTSSSQSGQQFSQQPCRNMKPPQPPAGQGNAFQEECSYSQQSSSQSSRYAPASGPRRPEPYQQDFCNESPYDEAGETPTQGCAQDPATLSLSDLQESSTLSSSQWPEPVNYVVKPMPGPDTCQYPEPKVKSCALPPASQGACPSTPKNPPHHSPHEYDCYPVNEVPTDGCPRNQTRYIDRSVERNPYLEASFRAKGQNIPKRMNSTRCDSNDPTSY